MPVMVNKDSQDERTIGNEMLLGMEHALATTVTTSRTLTSVICLWLVGSHCRCPSSPPRRQWHRADGRLLVCHCLLILSDSINAIVTSLGRRVNLAQTMRLAATNTDLLLPPDTQPHRRRVLWWFLHFFHVCCVTFYVIGCGLWEGILVFTAVSAHLSNYVSMAFHLQLFIYSTTFWEGSFLWLPNSYTIPFHIHYLDYCCCFLCLFSY